VTEKQFVVHARTHMHAEALHARRLTARTHAALFMHWCS